MSSMQTQLSIPIRDTAMFIKACSCSASLHLLATYGHSLCISSIPVYSPPTAPPSSGSVRYNSLRDIDSDIGSTYYTIVACTKALKSYRGLQRHVAAAPTKDPYVPVLCNFLVDTGRPCRARYHTSPPPSPASIFCVFPSSLSSSLSSSPD